MANSAPWVVHKFGGSSVADADCFRRVAAISIPCRAARVGVVLSACKGVTDALLGLVALAERQDDRYRVEISCAALTACRDRGDAPHPESARLYLAGFDRDCHDLEGILHTVKLTRAAARNVSDLIAGYGEIWSTKLFHRFYEERGSRARPGAVDRCAAGRRRRLGSAGSRRPMGAVARESRRPRRPRLQRHADHHRLHRLGPARRADDARPQRQRLLRLHFRRACSMPRRSTSGRMWTAFCRPIRAGCPMRR